MDEATAKLIDNLGGNIAVGELTGCSTNAVSNWRKRGIPWRMRPVIADAAEKKKVELPAGFLDARAAA